MGTIVQEYGPIYGEVVNGTVSGRPNGSVYVPSTNTIEILTDMTGVKVGNFSSRWPNRVYLSKAIEISAQSQDLASYIQTQLYTDAECTTPACKFQTWTAGIFKGSNDRVGSNIDDDTPIVDEQTYYFRVQLMNNGEAVATTEAIAVVGLVE